MTDNQTPEPDWILEVRQWLQDRDNAHAVAVSAADNAALTAELARTNEQWEKSHQTALAIQDERDALRERVRVLEDALSLAYGHLWLVNDEPGTPIRLHSSGTAASIARKILRDLMTAKQRESGINAARAALEKAP